VETKTEIMNTDLALFDLEFSIINAMHIHAPPDQKLSIYAECEFGFPDANNPIKWTTGTVNCSGPQFCPTLNYKKNF
jgi:hypothetical protein